MKELLKKKYLIKEVKEPSLKYEITKLVLEGLPEWFGIPEAIEEYAKNCIELPFYACYIKEKSVGFVSIKQTSDSAAECYVIGIKKEYHRIGIGHEFLKICERYCKDKNLSFLQVKTLDDKAKNTDYLKTFEFYKAFGFKPLEVLPLWDECNPCLVMIKYVS